jgi:hypothetical protein
MAWLHQRQYYDEREQKTCACILHRDLKVSVPLLSLSYLSPTQKTIFFMLLRLIYEHANLMKKNLYITTTTYSPRMF